MTLLLPWVERPADQERIYGKVGRFDTTQSQSEYIWNWLRGVANLPEAAIELNIQWYTAWQEVAENYPDLKASTNFLQLQTELANVEEMLAAARRYYNATVGQYNATQHTVPSNIVARFGDFSDAEFFEVSKGGVTLITKPMVEAWSAAQ